VVTVQGFAATEQNLSIPNGQYSISIPNKRYKKLVFHHKKTGKAMIKLHGHEISGNSYKVRLMLSLLNLEYEWVRVNLMKGEHKSPEYLAKNPFGQVPLLVDDETQIADAQAILVYLARKYGGEPWLPTDALPMAQVDAYPHVLSWMERFQKLSGYVPMLEA